MNEILKNPRSGEEVQRASGGVPLALYSDVCRNMKECGSVRTLMKLLTPKLKRIILLQNPNDMASGHWVSISMNPSKNEIYFFSSYGGKPDEEKNKWLDIDGRLKSEQEVNPLNDALKQMTRNGWKVYYNDFPYQKSGDKTATCGIWVVAFLNSNLNPDEFAVYTNEHNFDAMDYYDMYF